MRRTTYTASERLAKLNSVALSSRSRSKVPSRVRPVSITVRWSSAVPTLSLVNSPADAHPTMSRGAQP